MGEAKHIAEQWKTELREVTGQYRIYTTSARFIAEEMEEVTAAHIAACHNALIGLNPEAVGDVVEALEFIRDSKRSYVNAGTVYTVYFHNWDEAQKIASKVLAKLKAT